MDRIQVNPVLHTLIQEFAVSKGGLQSSITPQRPKGNKSITVKKGLFLESTEARSPVTFHNLKVRKEIT